ncbi:MAG: T9SS type A sorting domain-containing protein [Ignavibacteria bacterium]|nr:T9SS type A sorting domain-containing protein [Ignavibacteria bacterium]
MNANAFTAQLRFNRSVLVPQFRPATSRDDGADRIITVTGTRPAQTGSGVLLELPFMVVLGGAACATVRIDSFLWQGSGVHTQFASAECEYCVAICREGGARLIFASGTLALGQNRPNPFNATTLIEYELIEMGQTDLFITDLIGRRVATLLSGLHAPGRYVLPYDASELPSGTYIYQLHTPSVSRFKLMEVVK